MCASWSASEREKHIKGIQKHTTEHLTPCLNMKIGWAESKNHDAEWGTT